MSFKRPSKEVLRKLQEAIQKFVPILKKSEKAKINEADTRIIVTDILGEIFGYNKYFELTAEQMIRGGYADYSIRLDDEPKAIIEIKSITTELKENHIRQAVNYAANEGLNWAFLTNARMWQIYRVSVSGKVEAEKFFEFDLLNMSDTDLENAYFITKHALKNGELDEFWNYKKALDPVKLVGVLLSEPVIRKLRTEFSKNVDYRVTEEEINDLLVSKIIRPELIKEVAISFTADSKEKVIELDHLSENQLKVLEVLYKTDRPLSGKEIKEILNERFDLGPIMRGLYKRFKNHLVRTKEGYYLDDVAKRAMRKLFGDQG